MANELAQDIGVAGRYATAVFELAQESRAVEALERDFAALKLALAQSPDLVRVVKSPVFSREEQGKAMRAILGAIAASPLSTQFVLVLASKRRLFWLSDIIRTFEQLVARQRGEIEAQVISARPLNEDETAELRSVLKARLGREPRLQTKIDPALLGGLVVKVGSRMIDSSLRTKLTGLRAAMRGN